MSVDALAAPAGGLGASAQDRDHYQHAADRRMCAAAYIDAEFRHSVLRDVYNDRVRRVAPSYGFDVVMVVWHAWRAWWLEAAQNLCILAVLAIGMTHSPLATLIAVFVLAIWYVLRVMRNLARRYVDYYTEDDIQVDIRQVRARARMLRRLLVGLGVALIVTVGTAIVRSGQPGRQQGHRVLRAGCGHLRQQLRHAAERLSAKSGW
jgi:hypothetical protein